MVGRKKSKWLFCKRTGVGGLGEKIQCMRSKKCGAILFSSSCKLVDWLLFLVWSWIVCCVWVGFYGPNRDKLYHGDFWANLFYKNVFDEKKHFFPFSASFEFGQLQMSASYYIGQNTLLANLEFSLTFSLYMETIKIPNWAWQFWPKNLVYSRWPKKVVLS